MAIPVNRAHRCTRRYLGNPVSPTLSLVGHLSHTGKYPCGQPKLADRGVVQMKWTIRNIEPDAVAMIAETADASGRSFGDLVSEAIAFWYDSLPYEDNDDSDVDCSATTSSANVHSHDLYI